MHPTWWERRIEIPPLGGGAALVSFRAGQKKRRANHGEHSAGNPNDQGGQLFPRVNSCQFSTQLVFKIQALVGLEWLDACPGQWPRRKSFSKYHHSESRLSAGSGAGRQATAGRRDRPPKWLSADDVRVKSGRSRWRRLGGRYPRLASRVLPRLLSLRSTSGIEVSILR